MTIVSKVSFNMMDNLQQKNKRLETALDETFAENEKLQGMLLRLKASGFGLGGVTDEYRALVTECEAFLAGEVDNGE